MRPLLIVPFLLVTFVALFAREGGAQTPATSVEELQPPLKLGTLVTVTDARGKQTTGKLRQWADGTVLVETGGFMSQFRSVPFDEISMVKKTDSRTNGYWVGFVAGAVPGLIVASLVDRYCYNEVGHCPQVYAIFGGLAGLAGGGIGWAIDNAIDGGPVLYSRQPTPAKLSVQPIYSPKFNGAGASLSFTF
jgi:hypothetical protein